MPCRKDELELNFEFLERFWILFQFMHLTCSVRTLKFGANQVMIVCVWPNESHGAV